jgi:hypothetical protein
MSSEAQEPEQTQDSRTINVVVKKDNVNALDSRKVSLCNQFPSETDSSLKASSEEELVEIVDDLVTRASEFSQKRKPSVGTVSLLSSSKQQSEVDEVFYKEYPSKKEAIADLYKLGTNPKLSPTDKRRVQQGKDIHWQKAFEDGFKVNYTISEPAPTEKGFELVCGVCGQYCLVRDYEIHMAEHKRRGY